MSKENISEMSFEKAMAELEEVIDKLEHGEVPLEDSIKLYERGTQLKKICEAKLKEAEQKVKNITLDKDGNSLEYRSESVSSDEWLTLFLQVLSKKFKQFLRI